jgi:hypothetical protein
MSVTELRKMAGLEAVDQPATQLRANRIEKDSRHRDALYKAVTDSCDPFSLPVSSSACLLNVATGRAASEVTKEYLTNSILSGHERHVEFRKECGQDEERILQPIKKRKVFNFAQENLKKRVKGKQKSAAESLRDVFIRILVILSKKTNFNLRRVMTFPITEYPLSIAHSDGSGLKTDKSKLLNKLEELQDGFSEASPHVIDVTLIDGGLLLHSFLCAIGKITSYRSLARMLLAHVCGSRGNTIHVLFDTYHPNSLKTSERKLRGADDHPFLIAGPQQNKAVRNYCKTECLKTSWRFSYSMNGRKIIMVQS